MEKLIRYWHKLKKNPLAYHLVLIALTLGGLALAAHFAMQIGTRHGARRTVPDFTGTLLAEAQQQARRHDLKLVVNDSLYVPAYAGGIVLDQLPEGGVEVKPGRTVYLTINSFRQKMVPVPYVAGRSLRQAKNMLETAGLGIDRLVYRPDMATNYVLAEYCDGKEITAHSRLEAEMGSGVTLHVGVAGGYGTTVTPRLAGYTIHEAQGRLWELGLNIGKVVYDEGINLLNQKDARVYIQSPGPEQTTALGTDVHLTLTLDRAKADKMRAEAERTAKERSAARLRQEQAEADSLAQLRLDEALAPTAEPDENTHPADTATEDEFFF